MSLPSLDQTSADSSALEVRGLVKDYAVGLRGVKVRAVDHLDLRVAPGLVYGLLGPNGSGKSTTIKALLGLVEPTAGECRVFGIASDRVEARRHVGYLPESPFFYHHLTGRELVRFYAKLCDLPPGNLAARIDDVIELVGLRDAADRRVRTYSKGMLQRIGLAQALVHDPKLVVLDEPTAGVDPVGALAITAIIRNLKGQGKTVLITSHLLGQIEEICDRVAILDRGRLVLEGSVAELVGRAGRQALVVDAMPENELAELRAWLAARGRTLEAIETPRARLDRIFLERVAKGGGVTIPARSSEHAAGDGRGPAAP